MPTPFFFFARSAGLPAAGLSPVFTSLRSSTGANLTLPTITELKPGGGAGTGWYTYQIDIGTGDFFACGVVDLGSGVSAAAERYLPVTVSSNDRLEQTLPEKTWKWEPDYSELDGIGSGDLGMLGITYLASIQLGGTSSYVYDLHDRLTAIRAANLDNVAQTTTAMTLTTGERNSVADALLDRANGVETGLTLRQVLRLILAVLTGKSTVVGAVVAFLRKDGTTPAVTLTGSDTGARPNSTIGSV